MATHTRRTRRWLTGDRAGGDARAVAAALLLLGAAPARRGVRRGADDVAEDAVRRGASAPGHRRQHDAPRPAEPAPARLRGQRARLPPVPGGAAPPAPPAPRSTGCHASSSSRWAPTASSPTAVCGPRCASSAVSGAWSWSRRWRPAGSRAPTRRSCAARPPGHPGRIDVLDWVRHSRGHGSWFQPDGLHLTFAGAAAFARFLVRARPLARRSPTAFGSIVVVKPRAPTRMRHDAAPAPAPRHHRHPVAHRCRPGLRDPPARALRHAADAARHRPARAERRRRGRASVGLIPRRGDRARVAARPRRPLRDLADARRSRRWRVDARAR